MKLTFDTFQTEIYQLFENNFHYKRDEFHLSEEEIRIEYEKYLDNIAQGNDQPDMSEMAYLQLEEKLNLVL